MPYIKIADREEMKDAIQDLCNYIESKGDLNYAICEIVGRCILDGDINYTNISEMIDAVHDAEEELRRRLLVPYEDKKILESDDLPSFKLILQEIEEK